MARSTTNAFMSKCAVPLLVLASLCGCDSPCENEIVHRARSPDGRHDAVMLQRACGATTGFSTQVSIVDPGALPTGGGKAFRADDDHGIAAAGSWEGSWAEMRWLEPDRLLIRYAAHSRIFAQESEVSSVHITYQSVAR
jgi:hypothetical protein